MLVTRDRRSFIDPWQNIAPENRRFLAVFKWDITELMVVNQTLWTHGKGRSGSKVVLPAYVKAWIDGLIKSDGF